MARKITTITTPAASVTVSLKRGPGRPKLSETMTPEQIKAHKAEQLAAYKANAAKRRADYAATVIAELDSIALPRVSAKTLATINAAKLAIAELV